MSAPAVLLALLQSAAAPPAPWLRETTAEWGLSFRHDNGATSDKHLPETMGGAALIFDAEGDGDQDVYCVQSGPLPIGALAVRTSDLPGNQLFVSGRAGPTRPSGVPLFRNVSAGSGADDRGYGQGAAAGDLDGDGLPEIFVANLGPDALLKNLGSAKFEDRTAASGISGAHWKSAALLFDLENDGDLDLWVCGYLKLDLANPPFCGRREPGMRMYCHPDQYPPEQDRVWRNDGELRFTDATAAVGIDGQPGKALGAIAGDWDGDGDLDVYVAHDSVENKYWVNQGGRFEDRTARSGTGVDGSGSTEASMGTASGDYDGDLDLDLIVTNFDEESDTLYRNDGNGLYADATLRAGIEGPSRAPVGFGVLWEDFDLDLDLDLFVANGHIIDNIEKYQDAKTYRQRPNLFEQHARGRYRLLGPDAFPLAHEPLAGRGAYSGDLDGDGRPDLLILQCNDRLRALRNESTGAALVVTGLARGTQVVATYASGKQVLREATAQPSYYGQCAEELLLALPGEERIKSLELRLLGGARQTLEFEPPQGAARLRVVRDAAGTYVIVR
ncbi:MAG: CRTAC1 family protein [Planctomycetes bacterium]|nr:CRTAC1 family protein [Planctomycetota bacterium]